MGVKYLKEIENRIDVALKNKMPNESKLIFVGELLAAYYQEIISIVELDKYLKNLGFTRQELYKWTDYVTFAEPQEDD